MYKTVFTRTLLSGFTARVYSRKQKAEFLKPKNSAFFEYIWRRSYFAASSTLSPAFFTSFPAPSMVLHPVTANIIITRTHHTTGFFFMAFSFVNYEKIWSHSAPLSTALKPNNR
jgi:hypothetical protein